MSVLSNVKGIVQIEGVPSLTTECKHQPSSTSFLSQCGEMLEKPASDTKDKTDLRCKVRPMFWVKKVEGFGMLV